MTATLPETELVLPEFDEERYAAGRYTGVLEIMDLHGDTKLMWDKNNPDEVELAKRAFDQARKKDKMLAYRVEGKEGNRGEVMREFDPEAERMILAPQLRGG